MSLWTTNRSTHFSCCAHPCLSSVAHDGPQEPRSVDKYPCPPYDRELLQSPFMARPLCKHATPCHHMFLPIVPNVLGHAQHLYHNHPYHTSICPPSTVNQVLPILFPYGKIVQMPVLRDLSLFIDDRTVETSSLGQLNAPIYSSLHVRDTTLLADVLDRVLPSLHALTIDCCSSWKYIPRHAH